MIHAIRKAWHAARPYLIGRLRHARLLGVTIGEDCRIYISQWGSEPFLVRLGKRVTVTDGVRFLTHDGSTCLFANANGARYQSYGAITVGDRVFIGCGAIILPGISIGDDCVIGAGAVVTRDVPAGSVCAGNPARIIAQTADLAERIVRTCASDDELARHADYRERVEAAIGIARHRAEG